MKEQKQASMENSIKDLSALLVQQTAELALKNRELEVEAALERVRSRTMAMQKSDELRDVIKVIYDQLVQLNFEISNAGFGMDYKENNDFNLWMADSFEEFPFKVHIPYFDHPQFNSFKEAKEKGLEFWTNTLTFEEKNKYFKYCFDQFSVSEETKEAVYSCPGLATSCVLLKNVTLYLCNYNGTPYSESENATLMRFGKVFEQTYTRFNDLKQAEAQVREAQIETALERVRSRSMAMHKSDELRDVIKVIYEQLVQLNFEISTSGFLMDYRETDDWNIWMADALVEFPTQQHIPYFDHPFSRDYLEHKANGPVLFTKLYSFEEKNSFLEVVLKYLPEGPEEVKEFLFSSPALAISRLLLKNIGLFLINYNGTPYSDSENSTLIRFGKVFEQTYTRFLDLQKAEAQAREAQIEAALERVRSRSMAMHKSDELRDVIKVIYEQLVQLNFEITDSGFLVDYRETDDMNIWMANALLEPTTMQHIPYFDHPFYNDYLEHKNKGPELFTRIYSIEERNSMLEHVFKYLPWMPEEVKVFVFSLPGHAISRLLLKNIGLYLVNYNGTPYSDSENSTLIRFGKVFEQAYTRFLDLQKAEVQAREAQIETALERVRSRSLAMHKSDELQEVIAVVLEQLQKLGINPEASYIVLFYEDTRDFDMWVATPGMEYAQKIHVPYFKHPILDDVWVAKDRGDIFLASDYSFEEKNSFFKYAFENSDLKFSPDDRKKYLLESKGYTRSFAFSKNSGLAMQNYEGIPYTNQENEIIIRFARVFEQAYTRFLDVKKAEEQAREAQIESALERVRASSLAMHYSDDLHLVIKVVSDQFLWLGLYFEAADFTIVNPDRSWDMWISAPQQSYPVRINVPYTDHKMFHIIEDAIQNQTDFLTAELTKDEKDSFFTHFFQNTVARNTPEERKQYVLNSKCFTGSTAYQKKISLSLTVLNYEGTPYTDQENSIIKRFGNVFEQAYVRFLDLQKAEVQAREAQIEAALERVRSRSLAMHKSDELQDVIAIVLEQLQKLGIKPEASYISIIYEDTRDVDMWVAAPVKEYTQKIHIPYFKHPVFDDFWAAKDRGDTFLASNYSLEEKNSFFKTAFENSDLKFLPDDRKKYILESKGYTRSLAWSKNSSLAIQNYEGTPFTNHENEIIKRFSSVFEQAFTRFLDVKKAEEQVREAQIETALERVRASSLAMHYSDDLHLVIKVVSDQFLWLGLYFEATDFTIVNPDRSWDMWLSAPQQSYPVRINVPYTDHKMFHILEDVIQNQTDFFTIALTKDEKDSFFIHFFQNTVARNTPEERKQYVLNSKCLTCSNAYQKKISLFLTVLKYEGSPYTDQENSIIKRFGNVFEQAYVRFLDLQKAEAQAREAQIETALERVRGKAMGMHSSEDLAATILAFYHELVGFSSVPIIRCGAGLPNKENYIADISSVSKTSAGELVEAIGKLDMSGHPMLKDVYDHWLIQQEYHNVLRGNEIKTYYQFVRGQLAIPDYSDDAVQYFYFPMFKEGSFYVITEKELSEQELQIYRRFTSVLSLTYKRYKDLKDAEERTRIAVREASLDRVRAEIASMRHADDLQRITPLVWRELLALGVPFFRCGVMIMDEKEEMVRFYLSTPDGESLAALNLEIDSLDITRNGVDHWRRQKVYTETWNKEQFIDFMKPLMVQGQIETAATYQGGEEPPESLTLQFVPFPQGMLYVGSSKPLTSAEIETVKALAEAFSVAYSRYEDFTKLEEAKAQVDQTLQDLRAAQAQLIQSEKMASLGELTAGIAHEIQNPLNFVNNFSEVNTELIDEMEQEINKGNLDEAKAIAKDIRDNQQKINQHGKRADAIVKGMLQHSRTSSGVKEPTNINALADEYLRLAYHGLRAKDKSFNATMKTDFDDTIGNINIIPQDIGRVILNLITNAFYAVDKKAKSIDPLTPKGGIEEGEKEYKPIVVVSTSSFNPPSGGMRGVRINVKDNGPGIPPHIIDKIFQPFFTTKPTGQGTGLGLSLSYDIVKAHGGELKVETKEGEGSEFIIQLPM